jgi:hypothetical protein
MFGEDEANVVCKGELLIIDDESMLPNPEYFFLCRPSVGSIVLDFPSKIDPASQ